MFKLWWTKPHVDILKCNVDVAIFPDQCLFGYDGMCIRDDTGQLLLAKYLKHFLVSSFKYAACNCRA